MKTVKNSELITRKQYMENSSELHHCYWLQFATENTKAFILRSLSVEKIKNALNSGDAYLNKIKIPYNYMHTANGGWWWDDAPINTELLKLAGDTASRSARTCIAKAMAKELAK